MIAGTRACKRTEARVGASWRNASAGKTHLKEALHQMVKHYANLPMQYTAIFQGCKNDNFQLKKKDTFLIFAQNIDRGYTLEPPH